MTRFQRFTSSFDGGSVTYVVPLDPKDQDEADKLNEEHREQIDAYNDLCARGLAGAVTTEVEDFDG